MTSPKACATLVGKLGDLMGVIGTDLSFNIRGDLHVGALSAITVHPHSATSGAKGSQCINEIAGKLEQELGGVFG